MSESRSYGERLLENIILQCENRGIPKEESESFLAYIYEMVGIRVLDMDIRQLRRLQQNLDQYFRGYLGGRKRRPGVSPEAWPQDQSNIFKNVQAGIVVSDKKEPVVRDKSRSRFRK